MSNIDTGGPAFPILAEQADDGWAHVGMSLRDYFAAKAMQGNIASLGTSVYSQRTDETLTREQWKASRIKSYAVLAYEVADAMLEARK